MAVEEQTETEQSCPPLSKFECLNKFRRNFAATHRKTYATFLGVLSAFSFSTSFMLIKLIKTITGAEAALVRVVTMVIILGSYCLYKRYAVFDVPRRTGFLLAIRTMTSTIGSLCAFSAVKFIPLPDFTSIQYSAIAFTSILARIFLKEMFSVVFVLAIGLSVLGVVMISRSDLFLGTMVNESMVISNTTTVLLVTTQSTATAMKLSSSVATTIGVLLALTSAFCQAVTYIVVKKMVHGPRKLHNVEIIYNFSLFSIPPMFLACIIWRAVDQKEMKLHVLDTIYIVIASLMGMLAQLFMNSALKLYDASYASLVRGSEIIFSFMYQATFFHLKGNAVTYSGIALIVVSVVSINVYKIWKKKRMQKKVTDERNSTGDFKLKPNLA